jgi:hypothetical protein
VDNLRVLGSFIKGFGRKEVSDIINALYIADKTIGVKPTFTFKNRDNNGVDSPEIRRLLFFNCDALLKQKEDTEFYKLGKRLAKTPSSELKWAAQYLKNGKTHLFPEEAEKAAEVIEKLKTN